MPARNSGPQVAPAIAHDVLQLRGREPVKDLRRLRERARRDRHRLAAERQSKDPVEQATKGLRQKQAAILLLMARLRHVTGRRKRPFVEEDRK
jgi:hypothetical protein